MSIEDPQTVEAVPKPASFPGKVLFDGVGVMTQSAIGMSICPPLGPPQTVTTWQEVEIYLSNTIETAKAIIFTMQDREARMDALAAECDLFMQRLDATYSLAGPRLSRPSQSSATITYNVEARSGNVVANLQSALSRPAMTLIQEQWKGIARIATAAIPTQLQTFMVRLPADPQADRAFQLSEQVAEQILSRLHTLDPSAESPEVVLLEVEEDIARVKAEIAWPHPIINALFDAFGRATQKARELFARTAEPKMPSYSEELVRQLWLTGQRIALTDVASQEIAFLDFQAAGQVLQDAMSETPSCENWGQFDAALLRQLSAADAFDAATQNRFKPYSDSCRKEIARRFMDLFYAILIACDFPGRPATQSQLEALIAMPLTSIMIAQLQATVFLGYDREQLKESAPTDLVIGDSFHSMRRENSALRTITTFEEATRWSDTLRRHIETNVSRFSDPATTERVLNWFDLFWRDGFAYLSVHYQLQQGPQLRIGQPRLDPKLDTITQAKQQYLDAFEKIRKLDPAHARSFNGHDYLDTVQRMNLTLGWSELRDNAEPPLAGPQIALFDRNHDYANEFRNQGLGLGILNSYNVKAYAEATSEWQQISLFSELVTMSGSGASLLGALTGNEGGVNQKDYDDVQSTIAAMNMVSEGRYLPALRQLLPHVGFSDKESLLTLLETNIDRLIVILDALDIQINGTRPLSNEEAMTRLMAHLGAILFTLRLAVGKATVDTITACMLWAEVPDDRSGRLMDSINQFIDRWRAAPLPQVRLLDTAATAAPAAIAPPALTTASAPIAARAPEAFSRPLAKQEWDIILDQAFDVMEVRCAQWIAAIDKQDERQAMASILAQSQALFNAKLRGLEESISYQTINEAIRELENKLNDMDRGTPHMHHQSFNVFKELRRRLSKIKKLSLDMTQCASKKKLFSEADVDQVMDEVGDVAIDDLSSPGEDRVTGPAIDRLQACLSAFKPIGSWADFDALVREHLAAVDQFDEETSRRVWSFASDRRREEAYNLYFLHQRLLLKCDFEGQASTKVELEKIIALKPKTVLYGQILGFAYNVTFHSYKGNDRFQKATNKIFAYARYSNYKHARSIDEVDLCLAAVKKPLAESRLTTTEQSQLWKNIEENFKMAKVFLKHHYDLPSTRIIELASSSESDLLTRDLPAEDEKMATPLTEKDMPRHNGIDEIVVSNITEKVPLTKDQIDRLVMPACIVFRREIKTAKEQYKPEDNALFNLLQRLGGATEHPYFDQGIIGPHEQDLQLQVRQEMIRAFHNFLIDWRAGILEKIGVKPLDPPSPPLEEPAADDEQAEAASEPPAAEPESEMAAYFRLFLEATTREQQAGAVGRLVRNVAATSGRAAEPAVLDALAAAVSAAVLGATNGETLELPALRGAISEGLLLFSEEHTDHVDLAVDVDSVVRGAATPEAFFGLHDRVLPPPPPAPAPAPRRKETVITPPPPAEPAPTDVSPDDRSNEPLGRRHIDALRMRLSVDKTGPFAALKRRARQLLKKITDLEATEASDEDIARIMTQADTGLTLSLEAFNPASSAEDEEQ